MSSFGVRHWGIKGGKKPNYYCRKSFTHEQVICGKPDLICLVVQEMTCFSGETAVVWCCLNWTSHFIKLVFEKSLRVRCLMVVDERETQARDKMSPMVSSPIFTPWDCVGATAVEQLLPKNTLAEWGDSREKVLAEPWVGTFSIHCVIQCILCLKDLILKKHLG